MTLSSVLAFGLWVVGTSVFEFLAGWMDGRLLGDSLFIFEMVLEEAVLVLMGYVMMNSIRRYHYGT